MNQNLVPCWEFVIVLAIELAIFGGLVTLLTLGIVAGLKKIFREYAGRQRKL